MTYQIEALPGVSSEVATKLINANVRTTDDLLKLGNDPQAMNQVATRTGLEEPKIRRLVGTADLMRVKGIVPQIATLLQETGVESVDELAKANPTSLAQALADKNVKEKTVVKLPTSTDVESWRKEAKQLLTSAAH
jgi:predicted RecB family nuclease